jgi:hypothetical protein
MLHDGDLASPSVAGSVQGIAPRPHYTRKDRG